MSDRLTFKKQKHLMPRVNDYPSTRFMGSKEKILDYIWSIASQFEFNSVLDLFSGSGVVSYLFKSHGKKVLSNDYMHMTYAYTKSLIENDETIITDNDLALILNPENKKDNFVTEKFRGLYFSEEDNQFIDTIRGSVYQIENEYKKYIILSSLIRACLKKRPRGIFTYTGFRYDDGRRDLKLSLKEHFVEAIEIINNAVLNNGKHNQAFRKDALELDVSADLVYIDPPYYSKHSDNDYIRRYHFVEGLARNWSDIEFQEHTKTKKFKSYSSPFRKRETTVKAFEKLISKYSDSILLISYSSNSLPNKSDIYKMLEDNFSNVKVEGIDYKYSFGNQGHKVGNNNNEVSEYIFLGY
jgi:DNA adenine methylase